LNSDRDPRVRIGFNNKKVIEKPLKSYFFPFFLFSLKEVHIILVKQFSIVKNKTILKRNELNNPGKVPVPFSPSFYEMKTTKFLYNS